jgi:hypothetical protein
LRQRSAELQSACTAIHHGTIARRTARSCREPNQGVDGPRPRACSRRRWRYTTCRLAHCAGSGLSLCLRAVPRRRAVRAVGSLPQLQDNRRARARITRNGRSSHVEKMHAEIANQFRHRFAEWFRTIRKVGRGCLLYWRPPYEFVPRRRTIMARWITALACALTLSLTLPFGNAAQADGVERHVARHLRCTAPARFLQPQSTTWVCKVSQKCCYDRLLRKGTCLEAADRCI